MLLARCIKKTKHSNVGDILEIGTSDHPFITSQDFEIYVPTKVVKKKAVKKPKFVKKPKTKR